MVRSWWAFLFMALVFLSVPATQAQPWTYDFGAVAGSFAAAGGISESFLPTPPVNGGTARVRVGSAGGGFILDNQTIPFGTDAYLRIAASAGGSVNKFSVYNYVPSPAFTLRFRIRFGDTNGEPANIYAKWYLCVGDGASFSDNSAFTGSQMFTGLEWTMNQAGTVTMKARVAATWDSTIIDKGTLTQGTPYLVEIYGNNTAGSLPYVHDGVQDLGVNTLDVWINGARIGNDVPKAQLADGTGIDSWMFYGINSPSNAANIFIDDLLYLNDIAGNPLPVQLVSFTAVRVSESVQLTWKTISEINNFGFSVERERDGTASFIEVPNSFVAGHATTLEAHTYTYTDNTVMPGVWYYRLRQVDLDGKVTYAGPVRVEFTTEVAGGTPFRYGLSQNYPNPFNPSTCIPFSLAEAGTVSLMIYDVLGRVVAVPVDGSYAAGMHRVMFNANALSGGAYFYVLKAGAFSAQKSMMLVR